MKYFILLCCIITLPLTAAFAQQDKRAQDILDAVSKKYKSYSTIQADFIYTLESRADKTKEEHRGTLYLKDEKFKINLGEQVVISDNKNIWIYMKKINEVQINTYNPKDLEINPSDMFTIYEKGYLYKYEGEEKGKDGKTLQVIDLTPIDKSHSYFKVRLLIDRPNSHIVKTQIFDKTGNIYTFEILRLTPNNAMADTMFQFVAREHPGVTVVDLR